MAKEFFTKGRIACCAVIEDWMIPFAAYTIAFSGPDNPQKLSLGMRADIADVITHAKFCDSRLGELGGLGVLIPPLDFIILHRISWSSSKW